MKVVGKSKAVARKATCAGCGSILEYYRNDVNKQGYTDYGGGYDVDYWINCCSCGKRVPVKPWYE